MSNRQSRWGSGASADSSHPRRNPHPSPRCRREVPETYPSDYEVTKYIVDSHAREDACSDSNGSGDTQVYVSLKDAMRAAIAEYDSDRIPTILMRPGEYELPSEMKTKKKINFVASSFGANQTPVVHGCAESGGNKGWYGVKFVGSKSEYTVNNQHSCKDTMDLFCKCEFTDNFKLSVMNDTAMVVYSKFNYDGLDRDRVLEIYPGKGQFIFCNNKVYICRTGSSCARSFFHAGGDSLEDDTLFKSNVVEADIGGTSTFTLFHLTGPQIIHSEENHIHFNRADPKTYIFGSPVKQNNITLFCHASVFIGPNSGDNVAILANIWPKLSTEQPIAMHVNEANYVRTMWYGEVDCNDKCECHDKPFCCSSDGSTPSQKHCGKHDHCGKKKRCCKKKASQNCQVPSPSATHGQVIWTGTKILTNNKAPYTIVLTDTSKMEVIIVNNHTYAPVSNLEPLIYTDVDPTITTTPSQLKFYVTGNTFVTEAPPPVTYTPPWLDNGIPSLAISFNSTTSVSGYGKDTVHGSGTTLLPVLVPTIDTL